MKILITGVSGQDGSYLAEKLLQQGHEVHGIIRRSSSFNTSRLDHIFDKLILHYGDITDPIGVNNIISKLKPDRIYNLAAMSHVAVSFETPLYTANVDGIGTLILVESVKNHCPECRIYQASTSELYGKVLETPQTEVTPFNPQSPYAISKQYSYWITKNYRDSYGMFISNGILFNHESERRGSTFVSKKITEALVKIKNGKQKVLKLGNLMAKRDWGYAPEYCDAMIKIMEHSVPDDFVVSTGEMHTVKEFIEEAGKYVNFDIIWKGEGLDEKGIDAITGDVIVEVDSKYFRPAEVELLLGDPTKARTILGWEPKVTFKELVKIMMEHDIATGGKSLMGT